MPLPLPFIVGAVVGAVLTYAFSEHPAKKRNWLSNTGAKIKDSTNSLVSSVKKTTGDMVDGVTEKVKGGAKAVKS